MAFECDADVDAKRFYFNSNWKQKLPASQPHIIGHCERSQTILFFFLYLPRFVSLVGRPIPNWTTTTSIEHTLEFSPRAVPGAQMKMNRMYIIVEWVIEQKSRRTRSDTWYEAVWVEQCDRRSRKCVHVQKKKKTKKQKSETKEMKQKKSSHKIGSHLCTCFIRMLFSYCLRQQLIVSNNKFLKLKRSEIVSYIYIFSSVRACAAVASMFLLVGFSSRIYAFTDLAFVRRHHIRTITFNKIYCTRREYARASLHIFSFSRRFFRYRSPILCNKLISANKF